jgi:hypothetical protein
MLQKTIITIFGIMLLLTAQLFAQPQRSKFDQDKNKDLYATTTWFGGSMGINSYSGALGANFEQLFNNNLTIHGGAGIGTWGNKYALGIRRYRNYPLKSSFSVGISAATGYRDIEFLISARRLSNNIVVDTTLNITMYPAASLNFSWGYFFKIGNKSRMNIDLGYSLRTSPNRPYRINTPGYGTTEVSDFIMRILSPGGIILHIGFSFGM